MTVIDSLQKQAMDKTISKVEAFSDQDLLTVWKAATGPYAHPEDGYCAMASPYIVLTWDQWMDILYSEISKRGLSAL